MKLMELLRRALGLPDDADEAACTAKLTAVLGNKPELAIVLNELQTEVTRLTANQFDPTKHVTMDQWAQANNQIAELTEKANGVEKTTLLSAALADGRILPNLKEWAEAQPLAVLKSYCEKARPMKALAGQQSDDADPGAGDSSITDPTLLKVCELFGNDPALVQKNIKE